MVYGGVSLSTLCYVRLLPLTKAIKHPSSFRLYNILGSIQATPKVSEGVGSTGLGFAGMVPEAT